MIDKFGGEQLLRDAFLRSEIEIKEYQDKQAMKAYAYYKNNIVDIKNFLTAYLLEMINHQSLSKMPRVILNYIPKMVKRLTLAYNVAPISEGGDLHAELTRNLNKWRKEFHRQAKLFNTVLIRPIYKEDKNLFDYMLLSRAHCNVICDELDHSKMEEVNYKIEYHNSKGDPEDYTIHWTDDKHWATDKNGKEVNLDFMPEDQVNPYGKIPFVVLRLEDSMDFWGDGMIDVVQGNEHLNGRLTDTFFKLYMSFGVPLGTNLGIKSNEFYLSPDMPIMVDNARAEMASPNLQFITPEQKVELDKLVSDWFINEMGISKGLSAGSFSEKETAQSGYAKQIENQELLDLNRDDQDALRMFEQELFEMQGIVLKVDAGKILGSKLNFEFTQFEFPKSDDEIWMNREKEFQYNISTPIDWLREYRPEATDEELTKLLKDNQKTNSEMKRTLTRLEALVNGTANQNTL
jgi:hypothetical protein